MQPFISKSKQWWMTWLIVWIIMYLFVIFAYPSSPSIWFGWVPSSLITTFGLMVVTLILAYLFCKQRFKA